MSVSPAVWYSSRAAGCSIMARPTNTWGCANPRLDSRERIDNDTIKHSIKRAWNYLSCYGCDKFRWDNVGSQEERDIQPVRSSHMLNVIRNGDYFYMEIRNMGATILNPSISLCGDLLRNLNRIGSTQTYAPTKLLHKIIDKGSAIQTGLVK